MHLLVRIFSFYFIFLQYFITFLSLSFLLVVCFALRMGGSASVAMAAVSSPSAKSGGDKYKLEANHPEEDPVMMAIKKKNKEKEEKEERIKQRAKEREERAKKRHEKAYPPISDRNSNQRAKQGDGPSGREKDVNSISRLALGHLKSNLSRDGNSISRVTLRDVSFDMYDADNAANDSERRQAKVQKQAMDIHNNPKQNLNVNTNNEAGGGTFRLLGPIIEHQSDMTPTSPTGKI